MAIQGLIFKIQDLIQECHLLKTLAKEVLDNETTYVLDEARSTLENIKSKAPTDKVTSWRIRSEAPLRTIFSEGESQPDNNCGHNVRAEISFVWDIRPLDE